MDKIHQVCSECKLFTNEDSFGDGWCEFHQKETFCENGACIHCILDVFYPYFIFKL